MSTGSAMLLDIIARPDAARSGRRLPPRIEEFQRRDWSRACAASASPSVRRWVSPRMLTAKWRRWWRRRPNAFPKPGRACGRGRSAAARRRSRCRFPHLWWAGAGYLFGACQPEKEGAVRSRSSARWRKRARPFPCSDYISRPIWRAAPMPAPCASSWRNMIFCSPRRWR